MGGDIKEATGIVSTGQTMSLYMCGPHGNSETVKVTCSADSRVMTPELFAKWLQLLKTIVADYY